AVVAGFREFPDHHPYDRTDIESLVAWCEELHAELAVCTAKDLVKLGIERLGRLPLGAVAIELEFVAGQQEFEARLQSLFASAGE
ncbi:MAG TPA: tetraacyldisaccharide 4'-kinase, partial [Pirellulales bacterium]|nr:tetraacyldisaccharide 4'-kinase [Pirellulales bacterium]